MTFLTTRSAARILIINSCHRQALLLTRVAVLLGEGRPDTRERRKSSLRLFKRKWKIKKNCRLSLLWFSFAKSAFCDFAYLAHGLFIVPGALDMIFHFDTEPNRKKVNVQCSKAKSWGYLASAGKVT